MITLHTPNAPAPARHGSDGARGAPAANDNAGVQDFGALMTALLPDAPKPDAAGAAPGAATDATQGARDDQAPASGVADPAAIVLCLPPITAAGAQSSAAALAASGAAQAGASPVEWSRAKPGLPRAENEEPRRRAATTAPHALPPSGVETPAPAAHAIADLAAGAVAHATETPGTSPPASRDPEMLRPGQTEISQASLPALRATDAAAPAANAPRIEAQLGSARWGEELAGHVTLMLRGAVPEADIRVTPPELGPIHARITVDNGIAVVTFSAAAPETRAALEASLASLRERLADAGLALGGASVSDEHAPGYDAHAQRGEDRTQHGEDRAQRGVDRAQHGEDRAQRDAQDGEPVGARRLRVDGLIDLYA